MEALHTLYTQLIFVRKLSRQKLCAHNLVVKKAGKRIKAVKIFMFTRDFKVPSTWPAVDQ